LKFNICSLPTSFLANHSVPHLSGLILDNIGYALAYACQFWSVHLAIAADTASNTMWDEVKDLLSSTKLLYWFEVMSLTGASP
ncbi:hypothetical protein DL93DRAFT_2037549, partial [Clavulina sp. PMI_390]